MSETSTEPRSRPCPFFDPEFGSCPHADHRLLSAIFVPTADGTCPHYDPEDGGACPYFE